MAEDTVEMQEIFTPGFWTMKRRAWLYGIVAALVPTLVVLGTFTNDVGELLLQVAAAVLAVGGSSMALTNLTPDNVFKVGVEPHAMVRRTTRKSSTSKK